MSGKGSGAECSVSRAAGPQGFTRALGGRREGPWQALGHDPAASALSLLVQILVARASDPTIKPFGSGFRPQSKNVRVLELLQLRLVFRLYIISYVSQHSSGGWVNLSSKLRA